MPKTRRVSSHPYADSNAFKRLMLLIATLVEHPGVGSSDPLEQTPGEHHNALLEVQARLKEVAQRYSTNLTACSVHTLRKDLGTLRQWGILNQQMYRWGYFVGTGVMSWAELQVALNALYSQAQYQQDPEVSRIYHLLKRRLRGTTVVDELFYPIRVQLNRAIVHTDPEEMMAKGQYRRTLFHQIKIVEKAIIQGQAIELDHCRNPRSAAPLGNICVYPLQLIYSDIAWYLLHEECANGHLAIVRIDRFNEHCRLVESIGRGSAAQGESLQAAHRLLKAGWGLHLGSSEEQRLERLGQLPFIPITVRFFPRALEFVLEGERRHSSQKILEGPKVNGQITYVDYTVELPQRSHKEFIQWVYRFMGKAVVLSPPELVEEHKKAAQELCDRYGSNQRLDVAKAIDSGKSIFSHKSG